MSESKIKNKGGRPTKLDTIDLEEVEFLGGLGFNDEEIAGLLKIATASLYIYKKKAEFMEAIKRGKDKADNEVLRALYTKATNGDTTAMIFWLKNRKRNQWNENRIEETNDKPIIVDNIPNDKTN